MKKEEIESVDFDFEEEEVEEIEPSTTTPTGAMSDEEFQKLMNSYKEQHMAYVDQRIGKIATKIKEHQTRIVALEKTVENHAEVLKTIQGVAGATVSAPATKVAPHHPNVIDSTLGAVGGVLHGVVDTTAFLLESVVDLVTLGKARRTTNQ